MKRLIRVLIGYRDDLNLASRWWHRLLKVFFVLSTAAALCGGVILAAIASPVRVSLQNVTYTDLDSYIKTASKTVPNLIPDFMALDGTIGRIDNQTDPIGFLFRSDLSNRFCNRDAYAHLTELLAWLNRYETDPDKFTTRDGVKKALKERGINEGEGMCMTVAAGKDLPDEKYIINYKIKRRAQIVGLGRWLVMGTLATLAWCLLLGNIYYRGVVYVAFGKRRQSNNPTAV